MLKRIRETPVFIRILLAIYFVTVAAIGVLTWVGAEVAGDEVEHRLVDDMTRNTAALLQQLRLRPSHGVVVSLSQICDGHVIVYDTRAKKVVGSSYSGKDTAALRKVFGSTSTKSIELDGQWYAVGSRELSPATPQDPNARNILYVLIPQARIEAAQSAVRSRIVRWAVGIFCIATIVAAILSMSISHPIRRLALQTESMSKQLREDGKVDLDFEPPTAGPSELLRLGGSFTELLENLKAAQGSLSKYERLAALGMVSASVAHELRNPLSGIKMHVRLLQDSIEDDEDAKESLALVAKEIERMDLFLDELMMLAKDPDNQGVSLNKETTSLKDQAEHVIRLLAGRFKHSDVKISSDYGADQVVLADPARIRQVLMNLLLNALEASSGEVKVRINPIRDRVRVSVIDNGGGVQNTDDVFDAFVTTKFTGAGLGLYLSREIIQNHGGEIGFENKEKGAEFWFELPLTEVEDTA